MNNPSISIIIPTYKEVGNIEHLVRSINCAMKGSNYEYEIILVDDNSEDGIESLVPIVSKIFPIRIKIRRAKRDLSASVIDGIKLSIGDILVVMDADLSHPPNKVPELIKPIIDKKCDISIGSRFVKGAHIEGVIVSDKRAAIKVIEYKNGYCEVDIDVTKDGFLIFSENYYPGWHVYLDGEESSLIEVKGLVQGVFLKTGRHRVVFEYRPNFGIRI